MGKITDAELLAAIAQKELDELARLEGHANPPRVRGLANFIEKLPPSETSLKNREQECENSLGIIISRNIANLFKK